MIKLLKELYEQDKTFIFHHVTCKLVENLEKSFEYSLHFNNNVLNSSNEIITFF